MRGDCDRRGEGVGMESTANDDDMADSSTGGSRNDVTGTVVGAVVQSRVIYGGVHIQQAPHPVHVPRQLPPVAAHFTDRTEEASALTRIAEHHDRGDGSPRLVVLTGQGGVGKTALAVSWAARNGDRYPGGQLYADLRGFATEGAVSSAEVLGRFLRALGIAPEQVPVELAEQIALFRTITAGSRLLLVVDNARSAAQVRPLLPSSRDCMVLVTSRLRLTGLHAEGAEFLEVAPLPHRQAVELLVRTLGGERVEGQLPHVDELASLCGRLPIALRVAGARLASRPRWEVGRVVAELGDERRRLAKLSVDGDVSVAAAFDLSYQALPDLHARLYQLTSLHPGPDFCAGVAAAAAELRDDEAEEGVQALVDASLLEEVGYDRYRFHDLLRLHGRALADRDAAESDRARRRIAEWFLHQATRANMVVIPLRWRVGPVSGQYHATPPLFADGVEALEWLDGQLPNLLAVLEDASARGWDELAWQLCEALWELFLHRKHYRHWTASHQLGVAAARRCGDEVAESRLRCQLARAYLDLHRFREAEAECLLAAELARRTGSKHNESVAVDQLGMAAQGQGQVDRAIDHFRRSLLIERELGIDRGVAQRYRRIGEALLQAGRDAEAADYLERAREKFAALSDTKDEAKVLIGLARVDARSGAHEVAIRRLTLALRVLRNSGSAAYEVDALVAFAEVHRAGGDPARARQHLVEALGLARRIGGPHLQRVRAGLADLGAPRQG